MNEKKICVIINSNNAQESDESIRSLVAPEGYELEINDIKNTSNISKEYNKILDYSNARYKIYLQAGVSPNSVDILKDIIKIFKENKEIGMLGIVGAVTISTTGIWQESIHKYGKYVEVDNKGKKRNIEYGTIQEKYQKVKVINGMFIATQYDIKWRDDLFDDKYFYDVAQCVEFIKAGYEIAVIKQEKSCIITTENKVSPQKLQEYKEIFLKEYSKDIFPLVSILIPAYNRPELFRIALESAISQTYRNIEIIVGDDSTNNEVEIITKDYMRRFKNIKYIKNISGNNDKGVTNVKNCIEASCGEYINFLNDDDIFHKQKIEKMMKYFIDYDSLVLVTSYRKVINYDGYEIEPIDATKKLFNKDTVIKGKELMGLVIQNLTNYIGEPTTVLFKKDKLIGRFGTFRNYVYYNVVDVATWFSMLLNGDAVYISEGLSYYRIHQGQNQNNINVFLIGALEWHKLIKECYQINVIADRRQYKKVIFRWLKIFTSILNLMGDTKLNIQKGKRNELYNCFNHAYSELLLAEKGEINDKYY